MEQEASLVWLDSSLRFEPVFEHSQRAWPEQFCEYSPDQGNNVQPTKHRAKARQKGAEGHPHDEQRVQKEDENRKRRINARWCNHP